MRLLDSAKVDIYQLDFETKTSTFGVTRQSHQITSV